MADENQTPDTPKEPTQPTETEIRASDQGWVPFAEWTGEPDAWRPAKEFLDRGELFKKIDDYKRELKSVKATLDEFGKHHAQVREIEYKRALESLKAQKKEALTDGDADAVIEIDDKIAEVREAQKAKPVEPTPSQEPHPAFTQWQARNSWYVQERIMKAAADEVAREMVARGEQDPARILAEVDKQMRKEFPHKFENPNRSKANAVEGTSRGRNTSREDEVTMTDAEKAIMNKFVRHGVITKEDYLKEFKARQAG